MLTSRSTLKLMHTRRLFTSGLRALDILAMKEAHQLAVRGGDPYRLRLVRLEKIVHLLELDVRPKCRGTGDHNLFCGAIGSGFELFRADLAQQHSVLVKHRA